MIGFNVPRPMKVASIWAVWAFLAIGALGWALFVVLDYFGVKEQAGWAQVVGAMLAIIGAGAFPYMHESHRQRQRAESFRLVLLLLAQQQVLQMGRLIKTLEGAVFDFGDTSINGYLREGEHLRWLPHVEALQAIPVADLEPLHVLTLGDLKVGASFATALVERLNADEWNVIGDQELADIRRLQDLLLTAEVVVESLGYSPAAD